MTECGPIICSSRWDTLKLASCGKATTRMEVRIDSPILKTHAGEIVCRGANMMLGYYKNPEATAQIIDVNGWLHTGDLGVMDEEGYVTVRGRSKNMLLTSSGQNIYPEEIESKLNNMPYVAESLIVLHTTNWWRLSIRILTMHLLTDCSKTISRKLWKSTVSN